MFTKLKRWQFPTKSIKIGCTVEIKYLKKTNFRCPEIPNSVDKCKQVKLHR